MQLKFTTYKTVRIGFMMQIIFKSVYNNIKKHKFIERLN